MFLFLDIDGVLNTKADWKRMYTLRKENIENMCRDYPNSKIILISSWKLGFISSKNPSNSAPIKELESLLNNGVRIVGKVDSTKKFRDEQIAEYIKERPVIQEYLILDDDLTEYSSSFTKDKHLHIVNCNTGYI